jgi:streptomycin 6-kinase
LCSWHIAFRRGPLMNISQHLVANCQKTPQRKQWLANLPSLADELAQRWSLHIGNPLNDGATCSWVARVTRANGASAVLKLGMPHMEGEQEIEGLRFWNGNPTVQLLEAEEASGAMLLEECRPGTPLRSEPEHDQDEVIAALLRELHQTSTQSRAREIKRFRPLSEMLEFWIRQTLAQCADWPDPPLVREGLRLFHGLTQPSPSDVVLATDLHAGNVLRSQRRPWLAIDPKPFVGDPAFDVVQHLMNCESRLHTDPLALITRVSGLAGVDAYRVRLWIFARAAADPRENWRNSLWLYVARALSI